jgi:hypothetical protein
MSTPARWQKARVLPGNPTLPVGTELWLAPDRPEAMPTEEIDPLDPAAPWHRQPDSADRLMRTHLLLPGGWPLYTRLSQVELVADFRASVASVDALTIAGFNLGGLRLGRDPA